MHNLTRKDKAYEARDRDARGCGSRSMADRVGGVLLACCLGLLVPPARAELGSTVEVEESISAYEAANNGAGPMWCFGSTCIVRERGDVYVSTIETGKDVPPLCNTRWQLWKRDLTSWKLIRHEERFRQREPCPLGLIADGLLFMSVNPSTEPPGTHYGPCLPQVLEFDLTRPDAPLKTHTPEFADGTYFTDHSYRGFSADRDGGELVLLNINAKTSAYFISHRDRTGSWHRRGTLEFPIRACYPQIVLKNRSVHILAIGDILEPNKTWRQLKLDKTGNKSDYVFRRLFYTYTPDVTRKPFAEPVEVDTVEQTCGQIMNLDLYVGKDGAAHLLYLKTPYANPHVRNVFFPDAPATVQLEYMILSQGKTIRRKTLAATVPEGETGLTPGWSRFHVAPDGRLYVIAYGTWTDKASKRTVDNFLSRVTPHEDPSTFQRVHLKNPLSNFFTNTPRGGSAPSEIIDLYGVSSQPLDLRYARIRVHRNR